VIPSNVCSIDGSAFFGVNLLNCLIESENRRFVYAKAFLIDIVDHKLICNFSTSPHVEIPYDIEILGSSCFSCCQSHTSISFESNSRVKQIESGAFFHCSLRAVIPSTILFVRTMHIQLSLNSRLLIQIPVRHLIGGEPSENWASLSISNEF
jgi:hypothetical protein